MQINEVFEGLIKNPSNVYEHKDGCRNHQLFINSNGYFSLKLFINGEEIDNSKQAAGFNGNFMPYSDWQVVRKPVPWQEAIQAWVDGKTIIIKSDGKYYEFKQLSGWRFGLSEDLNGIDKDYFTQGKWFIAEGD